MRKFWLFFYGLPNILGLGLLLFGLLGQVALMLLSSAGGLSLLMAGMVSGLLYAGGWLLGWYIEDNNADIRLEQSMTADEIEAQLNRLLNNVKGRLPEPAYHKVDSIAESVRSSLPQLLDNSVTSQDLFTAWIQP